MSLVYHVTLRIYFCWLSRVFLPGFHHLAYLFPYICRGFLILTFGTVSVPYFTIRYVFRSKWAFICLRNTATTFYLNILATGNVTGKNAITDKIQVRFFVLNAEKQSSTHHRKFFKEKTERGSLRISRSSFSKGGRSAHSLENMCVPTWWETFLRKRVRVRASQLHTTSFREHPRLACQPNSFTSTTGIRVSIILRFRVAPSLLRPTVTHNQKRWCWQQGAETRSDRNAYPASVDGWARVRAKPWPFPF